MNIEADFEVWNGARYEVILGMEWLKEIDGWIECKEEEVHGKLKNDKFFFVRGKKSLPNTPTLLHLQMKRCGRKGHQVFLIHISEVENETKDDGLSTKRVKVFLDDFKDIFPKELNELPPAREVDHAIDLVANAASIVKAPYRHSLAQNVDLEN